MIEWGGLVEHYGLDATGDTESLQERLFFVNGVLPLEGTTLHLPWIQIKPGMYVDVHLISGQAGDWILLLDATTETSERRQMQQSNNELMLLRKKMSGALNLLTVGVDSDSPEEDISTRDILESRENRACILNAELSGFSTFSDRDRPCRVMDTLEQYLRNLAGTLIAMGGTLDKILGASPDGCVRSGPCLRHAARTGSPGRFKKCGKGCGILGWPDRRMAAGTLPLVSGSPPGACLRADSVWSIAERYSVSSVRPWSRRPDWQRPPVPTRSWSTGPPMRNRKFFGIDSGRFRMNKPGRNRCTCPG